MLALCGGGSWSVYTLVLAANTYSLVLRPFQFNFMFLGQTKFVLGPGWQAKKINKCHLISKLVTDTDRSINRNFVVWINKFVIVQNNHLVDGFCLQIITSKLEEKGSKTIIPRALQNGSLFYNCLLAFDYYAKQSQATVY